MNVTVAWEDVVSVVSQISGYLIVIGILFVAMVAVLVFAKKAGKSKSGFIRWQAVIVFGRPSGEGADLPNDMGAVLNGSYNKGTKYTNALYTNNGSYDDFEAGSSYLELSRTEREVVEMVCSNFEDVIIVYNGANALEMGWTEEFDQIKGVLLCASPGATGFNALGQIMNGTVNPSGKTVDTWLRDVTQSPTFNNFLSVETGEYEILIGSSVAEIHLSETVDVAGTDAPLPYNMSKLPHYASGEIKNIPDQELVLCSIVNA